MALYLPKKMHLLISQASCEFRLYLIFVNILFLCVDKNQHIIMIITLWIIILPFMLMSHQYYMLKTIIKPANNLIQKVQSTDCDVMWSRTLKEFINSTCRLHLRPTEKYIGKSLGEGELHLETWPTNPWGNSIFLLNPIWETMIYNTPLKSVFRSAPTLFIKYLLGWIKGFNWPVCTEFGYPNS